MTHIKYTVQIISNLRVLNHERVQFYCKTSFKTCVFVFFSCVQLLPSQLVCIFEILYEFAHKLVLELLAQDQFTSSLASIYIN